jgi:hypothetical protein
LDVIFMTHARPVPALDRPPASDSGERRRLPRQTTICEARVQCPTARPRPRDLPDAADFCPYDSREVSHVNLTRHGVGFVSDRPLPIGAFQTFHLDLGGNVVTGEIRILRCEEREDEGFDVGAAFC